MNPSQKARYESAIRRIGERTQDYLDTIKGEASYDQYEIHTRVAVARMALASIDRELFSLYGLLDKFRAEDHYTFNPDRPAHPTPAFTLDDL